MVSKGHLDIPLTNTTLYGHVDRSHQESNFKVKFQLRFVDSH